MVSNLKKFLALGLAAGALAACSTVPAGHVGVKVYLLGGSKGVDSEELGVGRYWIGMNEQLYIFPTYMQNYTWTREPDATGTEDESISFQTVEGMTANADVGISYQLDPTKINKIFQTYRRGVDEITDTFLRNMVRDSLVKQASTKPIEYIYGAGKAELLAAVQADVQRQTTDIGIKIDKIYWIGEIRLPETVIASINAKNAATQMAQQRQNEVAQARAEAEKKVAEARGEAESVLLKAKAQAEANRELASSITPELVQYRALDKWDGVLPRMTGNSAVPFINVDPTKGAP
jgi:regulator of protease activity HflC (stomatin/prohibitin superfamily)